MSPAGRALTPGDALPIGGTWQVCCTQPGEVADPEALDASARDWLPAVVPTTVAAALRTAGRWSLDGPTIAFDEHDWWFRGRFDLPWNEAATDTSAAQLEFEGLATLCDAWLNGRPLLSSDNMFIAYAVAAPSLRPRDNQLVLRFRALSRALATKRPRPRWRTPMLEQQQLRWFRTTLLGRTPGWSPPAAGVGPWRPIRLLRSGAGRLVDLRLEARLADGRGLLAVAFRLVGSDLPPILQLAISCGDESVTATMRPDSQGLWHAQVAIDSPRLWWPHTHGTPALYDIALATPGGVTLALGRVGFRKLELDTRDGAFTLRVNGERIFCRGACWTPLDPVTLDSTPGELACTLQQVRDAGMNMLRIGGTMVYETDSFHDLCDEMGILVWQDFMFASMDYPHADAAFTASVATEARQHLARLHAHPSLAVLCGNSEQEQQAAMWGAPRECWGSPLFHATLRAISEEICPHTPYWPSSAHGGAFPHDATQGTTSYYGVGAYLRPLEDARHAAPRFATECLAFANVPEPATIAAMPGGAAVRVHHATWAIRAPRDLGAGWDFDDVRDHYLGRFFGTKAEDLRYSDHATYLARSRATSAELMRQAFSEWRRGASRTDGALIWFLRDLWPGAGWGVIGSDGRPKAAWHALRETLQPLALLITDEGTNGLHLHVINEPAEPFAGELEIAVYRGGENLVAGARRSIEVPGRGSLQMPAVEILDIFLDLNFAYRFGPPSHDVVVATLHARGEARIRTVHTLIAGRTDVREDIGLVARASATDNGDYALEVSTRRFAYCVSFDVDSLEPDRQYFSLAPGETRQLTLRTTPGARPRTRYGFVSALNCAKPTAIQFPT